MLKDDLFLERAGELIQGLINIDPKSYWYVPIPATDDEVIAQVADLYVELTPEQKNIFRNSVTNREVGENVSAVIDTFSTRMAMLAVRRQLPELLEKGVIAAAIALDWSWTPDARDVAWGFPILSHSARELGMDPHFFFDKAIEAAAEESSKKWLRLGASDVPLNSIGFAALAGPAGRVYYNVSSPIPKGHLVPGTGKLGSEDG